MVYSPKEIRDNEWKVLRLEHCNSQKKLDAVAAAIREGYDDDFEIWLRRGRKFIILQKRYGGIPDEVWTSLGVKVHYVHYNIPSFYFAERIV